MEVNTNNDEDVPPYILLFSNYLEQKKNEVFV